MRYCLAARRGSVIVYFIILSSIIFFIPILFQLITVSTKETKHQLFYNAMADNVARAGIVDTISWFRRQTIVKGNGYYSYPDAAFYPRTASGDTEDEAVGLVKTYSLNENEHVWARYEVGRQQDPFSNPYDEHAIHDITDQRTTFPAGDGLVWYLESRGIVYKKIDETKLYCEVPNKILSSVRITSEIRQMSLALPVNASLIVLKGNEVDVYNNGVIEGGSTAVGVARVSGSGAQIHSGGTVNGNPAEQAGISEPTIDYVFGVPEAELKVLADYTVDTTQLVPKPYPTMAFVFVDGNITFNSSQPLRGGGILYVKGNLTLDNSSQTLFSGLIYVTGKTWIEGPALIQGAMISLKGLDINGGSDVAEIDFDDNILTTVRQQLAYYRENKSAHVMIPLLPEE